MTKIQFDSISVKWYLHVVDRSDDMTTTWIPEALHKRLKRLSNDEGRSLQTMHAAVLRLGLAAYAKKSRSRVGANVTRVNKNDTRSNLK